MEPREREKVEVGGFTADLGATAKIPVSSKREERPVRDAREGVCAVPGP